MQTLFFSRILSFPPADSFQFAVVGFDETYPLWAISSVGNGGLDWTVLEVGQVRSTWRPASRGLACARVLSVLSCLHLQATFQGLVLIRVGIPRLAG